ncbi:MAG: hypothetical protein WA476_12665 [Acidobacteriaceae bacterium]
MTVFRSTCLIALAVAVPLAWGQQLPTPNRPVLPAQQSPAPDPSAQSHPRSVMPAQDGGVREVLESIVIPPVANAPFTASLITEWVRYTPDGASITLINQRRIARDTTGRLYEERWALVPKNGDVPSRLQWVQIADPHQRTLYNCNMIARVCDLLRYDPAPDLAAASAPPPPNGPLPGGRGFQQTENLGARVIAGVDTIGSRTTTTLNPGTMGNDRSVVKTLETWRSEQLAVNLLSIRTDPLFGTQTFTISDLDAAAPDPQLFEVPVNFPVRDRRSVRPPSQ